MNTEIYVEKSLFRTKYTVYGHIHGRVGKRYLKEEALDLATIHEFEHITQD